MDGFKPCLNCLYTATICKSVYSISYMWFTMPFWHWPSCEILPPKKPLLLVIHWLNIHVMISSSNNYMHHFLKICDEMVGNLMNIMLTINPFAFMGFVHLNQCQIWMCKGQTYNHGFNMTIYVKVVIWFSNLMIRRLFLQCIYIWFFEILFVYFVETLKQHLN